MPLLSSVERARSKVSGIGVVLNLDRNVRGTFSLVTGRVRHSWASHVVVLLRLHRYPQMGSRGGTSVSGAAQVKVAIGHSGRSRPAIPTVGN
jgi:hypothetical protein